MRLPELPKINLMAFDPGKATGMVRYDCGDVETYTYTEDGFLEYLSHPTLLFADIYVVEEFRLYPHMATTLSNHRMEVSELIGIIRANAHIRGIHVVFQGAGQAKQLCTDELLKQYGWYNVAKNRHERDALRHALYYLITHHE